MAREMKDSGIEWIGEIPGHWKLTIIGRLFIAKAGGDAKPELYSDVCDEQHPYPVYTNSKDKTQIYAYTSEPVFKGNTITVTGRRDVGNAFYRDSPYDAIIRLISLSPRFELDCRYFAYWINNVIPFFTDNAAIGQLSATQIQQYKISYLSLDEQHRIADFLDCKCAEIDHVLEKTRASIEEYKKLKQSIITQAVTKGVRGEREMKDSGIEWIGEIPASWDINVMFQLLKQVKSRNEGLIENNLLSLSYGKIKRKDIDTLGGLLPESFDGYNIIEKNDIVIRLTDLQNDHKSLRVGLSPERGIITFAYVTVRNYSQNLPEYLYYYLHSYDIAKGFYGMGAGVRQGLNWDGLKNLQITIPSVSEQQEICNYLEKKCSEIDTLISKKEQFITKLESYKKSLIYEYVTGKKEVQ